MNREDLVNVIYKNLSHRKLMKKDIDFVLAEALDIIKNEVNNDKRVILKGFGSFKRTIKKTRIGVNPSTGERMEIPKRNFPRFIAGKEFKEILNK